MLGTDIRLRGGWDSWVNQEHSWRCGHHTTHSAQHNYLACLCVPTSWHAWQGLRLHESARNWKPYTPMAWNGF